MAGTTHCEFLLFCTCIEDVPLQHRAFGPGPFLSIRGVVVQRKTSSFTAYFRSRLKHDESFAAIIPRPAVARGPVTARMPSRQDYCNAVQSLQKEVKIYLYILVSVHVGMELLN